MLLPFSLKMPINFVCLITYLKKKRPAFFAGLFFLITLEKLLHTNQLHIKN